MALPPTIPTSFVPRSPASAERKYRMDFVGAFSFFCYIVLVLAVIAAAGLFLYGQFLTGVEAKKQKALADTAASIDSTVAQGLVRLNDRLMSGQTLLNNHVAFSEFFRALEILLPSTVRFSALRIGMNDTKIVVDGNGTAKTFNALAAASASFASDGRIKDAIFSHLTVNKDNSVTFSFTATLDPELVAFARAVPSIPASSVASSTSVMSATTTASRTSAL